MGGRKEVPSKSQAEVGAPPRAPSAPLSTPHAPFSEPPGWHMASPTEPDPVDHLRSPEPTAGSLHVREAVPQLRDPDTFKFPALSPLAEPPRKPTLIG